MAPPDQLTAFWAGLDDRPRRGIGAVLALATTYRWLGRRRVFPGLLALLCIAACAAPARSWRAWTRLVLEGAERLKGGAPGQKQGARPVPPSPRNLRTWRQAEADASRTVGGERSSGDPQTQSQSRGRGAAGWDGGGQGEHEPEHEEEDPYVRILHEAQRQQQLAEEQRQADAHPVPAPPPDPPPAGAAAARGAGSPALVRQRSISLSKHMAAHAERCWSSQHRAGGNPSDALLEHLMQHDFQCSEVFVALESMQEEDELSSRAHVFADEWNLGTHSLEPISHLGAAAMGSDQEPEPEPEPEPASPEAADEDWERRRRWTMPEIALPSLFSGSEPVLFGSSSWADESPTPTADPVHSIPQTPKGTDDDDGVVVSAEEAAQAEMEHFREVEKLNELRELLGGVGEDPSIAELREIKDEVLASPEYKAMVRKRENQLRSRGRQTRPRTPEPEPEPEPEPAERRLSQQQARKVTQEEVKDWLIEVCPLPKQI